MQERAISPSISHRAGAADAVLAADVGAGQQQVLAQEVGEVRARRDLGGDGLAVDGEGDAGHGAPAPRRARGARRRRAA